VFFKPTVRLFKKDGSYIYLLKDGFYLAQQTSKAEEQKLGSKECEP
jgi:hypothetical protein